MKKPDVRSKHQAFEASRMGGAYSFDPSNLTIPTDPTDPLYDKRWSDPIPDGAVLDAAAMGVIEPVVISKRVVGKNTLAVVVDGIQRVKRTLVVNALLGQQYRGEIQVVKDAIDRLKASPIGRRVIELCPDGPLRVPTTVRAGTDADAYAAKVSANFWRHDDPVSRRAEIAQRLQKHGHSVDEIAARMGGCSTMTVRRMLAIDTTKPREKKVRGGATRPSAKQVASLFEQVKGEITEREKALLKWILKGGDAAHVTEMFLPAAAE